MNVRPQDDLDPDGYRLLVNEILIEEGRASRDRRYLSKESVTYLPLDLQEMAAEGGPGDLWSIPAEVVPAHGIAWLITMAADEMIIRRLMQPAFVVLPSTQPSEGQSSAL